MADSCANLLFPNDTVILLTRPSPGFSEPPGSGDCESTDESASSTKLILSSPIPGTVDCSGATVDDIVKNIKFGYIDNIRSDYEKCMLIPVSQSDETQFRSHRVEPDKLKVIDRPIQCYSWIKYKNEIGFVFDINTTVDVQTFENDSYMTDLREDQVEIVPAFYRGLYVSYKGWIGVVTEVKQKIHLKYSNGTECFLTRSFNNGLYYQKLLGYINLGDELSPSGREIKDAKWVDGKEPGMINWFVLRYMNIGYIDSTTARVIGNEIAGIVVNWHSQINTGHPPVMIPSSQIPREELMYLTKLTLPKKYLLSRGTSVRVDLNNSSDFMDKSRLYERLAQPDLTDGKNFCSEAGRKEFGNHEGNSRVSSRAKTPEVVVPTEETVKVIEGKVFLRHATAGVLWKNGIIARVPVRKLIPYYPPEGSKYPIAPGTEVRKPNINSHKGIVQTSHSDDGYVHINWFGESSGDVPEDLQFNKETVERIVDLKVVQKKKFPIGLIVICLKTSEPGVVVGTNISTGNILVQMTKEVKEFERKELKVFGFSANFVNDSLIWVPLKENPSFPNEKHLNGYSSGLMLSPETLSAPTTMPKSLKQFQILPKPPMTHYGLTKPILFKYDQLISEALERDIKIFDQNAMPEGIWVKSYTDSPNLFSALIAGISGSSLQGGLFHIDIVFSQTYPNELPTVVFKNNFGESCKMELPCVDEDGLLDMETIFHGLSKSNMDLAFIIEQIREFVFGDKCQEDEFESDEYSYSQEIKYQVEKQSKMKNIIPFITNWLINTPKEWENEALHYYQFEVPRTVVRMNELVQYSHQQCQFEWTEDEEADSPRPREDTKYPSFLPFDTIMQAEIRKDLQELSHIYHLIY